MILKKLYRTKISLSLIILVIMLAVLNQGNFINHGIFMEKTYGLNINDIDLTIFYKFFTLLVFVRDFMSLFGMIFILCLTVAYEYLQGPKRLLLMIIIGNVSGILLEYLILHLIVNHTDYYDLGFSNAGFAILGGLSLTLNKKYNYIVLCGAILYILILLSIPNYWSYQIPHIAGLLSGLLLQKYFNNQNKIKIESRKS